MLVIFSGTYGVGKTHFMLCLSKQYGFKIIPTYITRALRINEIEKIHISKSEFKGILSQKLFLYVKKHFGEYYGIKERDVELASLDSNIWMLDFPIDKIIEIYNYPYKLIVILPIDKTQIIENLTKENRVERISVAVKDYSDNYEDLPAKFNDNHTLLIKNDFNKFNHNINLIIRFLKHQ